MKDLKHYIKESILDDIDDQIDNTDEIIKNKIIKWLNNNLWKKKEELFEFDFSTAPITVNYDDDISFKKNITSLTNGIFQWGVVEGVFNCSECKSLKSLEGAPEKVGGYFSCSACNNITSLKGAPEKVGGYFNCRSCESLKSLEGAPKSVGGDFYCYSCESLKSLEGAPKEVGGDFYCGTEFTEDDIKQICKVKGKIYC